MGGNAIYGIEMVLFASVSVAWLTVRQSMCDKWPLLDSWAIGGQGVIALVSLALYATDRCQGAQVPLHFTNVAIFVAYVFGFTLSGLSPDYAAGVTRLTCKCTAAGSYHTTLLFADSVWNVPLSAVTTALLLAQTVLSAACTTYTGGALESIAWGDMWTLSVLSVAAVSAMHANCDSVVWVAPIAVGMGAVCHVGLWALGRYIPTVQRTWAAVSLLLTIVLDATVLALAVSYRIVDVTPLAVFLAPPFLASIRNVLRASQALDVPTAQPLKTSQPGAAAQPVEPSAPPPDRKPDATAPSLTPSVPSAYHYPPPGAPYALARASTQPRLEPLVHSQSGYHTPPPDPMRQLFSATRVQPPPPPGGKKGF